MKKVTCAVAIFTSEGILVVHPTHSSFINGWSLPKGIKDEHETEAEAACREVFEETGLKLDPSELVDHGRFSYRKDKDYHMFSCKRDTINVKDLHCTSTFLFEEKEFKEVDKYDIIQQNQVHRYLNVSQKNIFVSVFN